MKRHWLLASLGTSAVMAIFAEPAENLGLRGGLPASEIELGFKVDI
jgi:hypothetical protein